MKGIVMTDKDKAIKVFKTEVAKLATYAKTLGLGFVPQWDEEVFDHYHGVAVYITFGKDDI